MFYLVKTPRLVERMYPAYVWRIPEDEKKIYLSFDDGPHPVATNFVLDCLAQFGAKASFFCLGKNVAQYPQIYRRIITEGHKTGNHTHDHLNGWEVSDRAYFENIVQAAKYIDSGVLRPPYGKITRFQAKQIMERLHYKIIMWSVISGDFDHRVSPAECFTNVLKKAEKGSIVVFHDSEKAFKKMSYALPKMLEHFTKAGYTFETLVY